VVAGIVLCSAGAGLAAAGVWALGSQRTPFPKPRPEAMLVQRGIYSRVRHPLYISVILLAFGWALTARNWPTLAAAGALGIFFDVKARREEKWLREKFPEYSAYEERTCRFLPRVY
jgi:protein-S-isoprenylcysteine O-methyltransferase Ste14